LDDEQLVGPSDFAWGEAQGITAPLRMSRQTAGSPHPRLMEPSGPPNFCEPDSQILSRRPRAERAEVSGRGQWRFSDGGGRLRHGDAAPFCRRDVSNGFGEGPLVASEVLGVVLPFAVFEILRLHQDSCTLLPSALTVSACVLHPHHHGVIDLAWARRPAIVANVADDHGSVANPQLGAVVLSNLHSLRKPEGAA